MTRSATLRALALGATVVALGACDSADADLSADELDDAAAVVANALAVDAGGALEEAAAGASLASTADNVGRSAGPDRPGCEGSRTYDEAAALWTVVLDCERGSATGERSASFERRATYRFLGADGTPQRERRGAAAVDYAVLSGTGLVRAPRRTHALTRLETDLAVTGLDGDLATVNGSYLRAATDTLRGARGERTVTSTLALTLDSVQGPKTRARRWREAVAGTVTGTFQATITRTATNGSTATRTIDEDFTVTFPRTGSGERVAEIAIGGRRYQADVETGDVIGAL